MKCKKVVNIDILNVRTIRQASKRFELANNFISSGLDILGIQQDHICHEDEFIIDRLDKYILITTTNGGIAAMLLKGLTCF